MIEPLAIPATPGSALACCRPGCTHRTRAGAPFCGLHRVEPLDVAPVKPCTHPGCDRPAISDKGRCDEHVAAPFAASIDPASSCAKCGGLLMYANESGVCRKCQRAPAPRLAIEPPPPPRLCSTNCGRPAARRRDRCERCETLLSRRTTAGQRGVGVVCAPPVEARRVELPSVVSPKAATEVPAWVRSDERIAAIVVAPVRVAKAPVPSERHVLRRDVAVDDAVVASTVAPRHADATPELVTKSVAQLPEAPSPLGAQLVTPAAPVTTPPRGAHSAPRKPRAVAPCSAACEPPCLNYVSRGGMCRPHQQQRRRDERAFGAWTPRPLGRPESIPTAPIEAPQPEAEESMGDYKAVEKRKCSKCGRPKIIASNKSGVCSDCQRPDRADTPPTTSRPRRPQAVVAPGIERYTSEVLAAELVKRANAGEAAKAALRSALDAAS